MNIRYWSQKPHTHEEFLAKLGEEFGEVSKARAETLRGRPSNLLEELGHLVFIADCYRVQVLDGKILEG